MVQAAGDEKVPDGEQVLDQVGEAAAAAGAQHPGPSTNLGSPAPSISRFIRLQPCHLSVLR